MCLCFKRKYKKKKKKKGGLNKYMYTAPIESNKKKRRRRRRRKITLFECQFNQHESTNWGYYFLRVLLETGPPFYVVIRAT